MLKKVPIHTSGKGGIGTGNGDFTAGSIYRVVHQLPIETWPVALVLLALGVARIYFYPKKRIVTKGNEL